MFMCIENPKESTAKKYIKGSGYPVNIQKLIVFLYTSNDQLENEKI